MPTNQEIADAYGTTSAYNVPTANAPYDTNAAYDRAVHSQEAWDAYRKGQKKPGLFGSAPKPPPFAEFQGDLNDEAQVREWMNNTGYEQQFQESGLAGFGSRTEAGARLAFQDQQDARAASNDRRKVAFGTAGNFAADEKARQAKTTQDIEAAFGGGIGNRLSEIDRGVQTSMDSVGRAQTRVDEGFQAADRAEQEVHNAYLTTLQKYNDIGKVFGSALDIHDANKASTLSRLADDTALQTQEFQRSIRAQSAQAANDIAASYDIDDPRAKTAMRQLKLQIGEQIGGVAQRATDTYNKLRTDVSTAYDKMRDDLASAYGGATASGLSSVAGAGSEYGKTLGGLVETRKGLAGQQLDVTKTISDIQQWGVNQKTQASLAYTNATNAASQLALAGNTKGAELMLEAANTIQTIPSFPAWAALFGMDFSLKQADQQQVQQIFGDIMSLATLGLTAFNIGGFGKPEQPKSDSNWFTDMFHGSGSVGTGGPTGNLSFGR